MKTIVLTCAAFLLPATAFAAMPQTTAPSTQPASSSLENLTLHPSAATQPAFRYSLLPDPLEQTPGDAVTLYFLARRFWPDQKTTNDVLSPENGKFDYLDPVEKFPDVYARRLLDAYSETLAYVDLGARRREAHWDTGRRERGFGGTSPFAYLNDLRHAENLLNFRGRLQVLHGDWDGAHYTLQTEFSLARQIGTEPLLIHALVQVGLEAVTLAKTVHDWIGHPDSPNLYWALTELPRPSMQLQPIVAAEQMALRYYKPQLWQALHGQLPPQEWPQVIDEMMGQVQESRPPYKRDPAQVQPQAHQFIDANYATARQALLAGGTPAPIVDAMSHEQVVGTYVCQQYNAISDELWRVWILPFPQAQEQMLRSWKRLAPDQPPVLENPLIQANLVEFDSTNSRPDYRIPRVLRSRYEVERADRHVALLRTIEALRDYTARHGGQPPQSLEQITELPLPIDPVTGKAFDYHLSGRTATLDAPPPIGRSRGSGWQYELIFAQ